jgi:hypothetical protein
MRSKVFQRKQTVTKRIAVSPQMIRLNSSGEIVIKIEAIKERSLKSTNFSFEVTISIEEKHQIHDPINFQEWRRLFLLSRQPLLTNTAQNHMLPLGILLPQVKRWNWNEHWIRLDLGTLEIDSLFPPLLACAKDGNFKNTEEGKDVIKVEEISG